MSNPEPVKYLWRFDDADPESDSRWLGYKDPPANPIRISRIPVNAVTPKGFWIFNKTKFVLAGSGKRWAYETIEGARDSFIRRKTWQIAHARATLEKAEYNLAKAQAGDFEEFQEPKEGELHW